MNLLARLGAANLDRQQAQHWELCGRGVTIEWRFRRYRRLRHLAGERATIGGYVGPRSAAMRAKGFDTAASVRLGRVRQIVANKGRD
jgi:hypothetical protein